MDWPYHFPHPVDVIAREAEATRTKSIEDRLDRLLDLIASGWSMAQDFHSWDAHCRLKQRSESDWQQAHREVFVRHAR